MKSGIYLIINVVNGKQYVGSSRSLKKREYMHWYELKRGTHSNPHLQGAYNLYGRDALYFVIVEYCSPVLDLLIQRENWWIELLRTLDPERGYNLHKADGTEVSEKTRAKMSAALKGHPGVSHTTEAREKMSAAKRGKPSHMAGKKHTAEAREKMSAALKGKPGPWLGKKRGSPSEETKRKLSEALKGREITPEARRKIGDAHRGMAHTTEAKAKMSASKKGRPGTWTGRTHTEETKKKISEAKRKKKDTPN